MILNSTRGHCSGISITGKQKETYLWRYHEDLSYTKHRTHNVIAARTCSIGWLVSHQTLKTERMWECERWAQIRLPPLWHVWQAWGPMYLAYKPTDLTWSLNGINLGKESFLLLFFKTRKHGSKASSENGIWDEVGFTHTLLACED